MLPGLVSTPPNLKMLETTIIFYILQLKDLNLVLNDTVLCGNDCDDHIFKAYISKTIHPL